VRHAVDFHAGRIARAACARQRRWRPEARFGKAAPVQVVTTAASGPSDDRVSRRAAIVSLAVACVLLAVKYAAYQMTGSAAILSDALESIANVVAALFAVGVLIFAGRPADRNHPYGHGKMEFFSAVFEGGLITFAAVLIVWKSVLDLLAGPRLRALEIGIALTVAAGLVNAALGWFLLRTGRRVHSITLVADGKHVLSDFWTTVGVVVGLGLVQLTGLRWLDPLAALVVAVNLGVTGARLVRRAAGALLDEEDTGLLIQLLQAFEGSRRPGIIRVHRLRARRTGRFTHVDAHLIVPEYWTVEQAHEATDAFAARVLDTLPIDGEMIFHEDPCRRALCSICDVEGCPVRVEPFVTRPPLTLDEVVSTDETWQSLRPNPPPAERPMPAAS
jgi:cation diffusion facilitator family transporter